MTDDVREITHEKRALKKRRYSAKETYNLKDPTSCSHPHMILRIMTDDVRIHHP